LANPLSFFRVIGVYGSGQVGTIIFLPFVPPFATTAASFQLVEAEGQLAFASATASFQLAAASASFSLSSEAMAALKLTFIAA
jgi:hypothetical protein